MALASAGLPPPDGAERPLPAHPRQFGRYELGERIAEGASSVVYRARDLKLNKWVALKLMRSGHFATEKELSRFRREAQTAANLDHPRIVPVYEIGDHEGWPFLAMQFISGTNLAQHAEGCPLPSRRAARLLELVARAVDFAHERGFLHCDLKPSNILLDEQGEPHLADFGLATWQGPASDPTRTLSILGTPAYMAPEIAAGGGRAASVASDVYGLGAVLFHVLTGRPLFTGASSLEVLELVKAREPLSPRALNPGVPRDLEVICQKCLRRNPADRYASAGELADDLARFLAHEPISARQPCRREQVWLWLHRHAAAAGLLATLLGSLGIGVGATWLYWRRAERLVSQSRDSYLSLAEDLARRAQRTEVAQEPPGGGEGLASVSADLDWHVVTGTSAQALPNHAYLAHSDSEVTLQLPPTAATGDIVRVAGLGAGGWRIVQHAGQSIRNRPIGHKAGRAWVARLGKKPWRSVAASADGNTLMAVALGFPIYLSRDAGVTWTAHETPRSWYRAAVSADGKRLIAAVNNGPIYTSADSGATWTAHLTNKYWRALAASADGRRLAAAPGQAVPGPLYTSADFGAHWTIRQPSLDWQGMASSADGSKLVAVAEQDRIYTSSDFGTSWTPRGPTARWTCVASSVDGTNLFAAVNHGPLYVSTDSGVTWTARATNRNWCSLAGSADGSKLIAATGSGQIFVSIDSGMTWALDALVGNWCHVASSADGARLVAAAEDKPLYLLMPSTSGGVGGSLAGDENAEVELRYAHDGQWQILSHRGAITAW